VPATYKIQNSHYSYLVQFFLLTQFFPKTSTPDTIQDPKYKRICSWYVTRLLPSNVYLLPIYLFIYLFISIWSSSCPLIGILLVFLLLLNLMPFCIFPFGTNTPPLFQFGLVSSNLIRAVAGKETWWKRYVFSPQRKLLYDVCAYIKGELDLAKSHVLFYEDLTYMIENNTPDFCTYMLFLEVIYWGPSYAVRNRQAVHSPFLYRDEH
jgi:hypothetical protein